MKDSPLDRLRHVYSGKTIEEVKAGQAEHIERYRVARRLGNHNQADSLLATINDFSKLLEERA